DSTGRLDRSALLVCAAPGHTAADVLDGGRFDVRLRPERMGRPSAAGTGGHQRSVGQLSFRLRAGRSSRWTLERVGPANLAALLRHGAHADDRHYSHPIHGLGSLFFLEKLAKSGRRRSETKIF